LRAFGEIHDATVGIVPVWRRATGRAALPPTGRR
jgi:hypothetical protein